MTMKLLTALPVRKRRMIGACLMVFASGVAEADAVYSYENDGKTYVAVVPDGDEAWISQEAADVLNANMVTNFVKRGDGILSVGSILDSFTGDVYVEDGTYRAHASKSDDSSCGYYIGGNVFVSDGATLRHSGTAWSAMYKRISFEGKGHAGGGAIRVEGADLSLNCPVGSEWVMTGDAMVYLYSDVLMGLPGNGAYLNMNGHTLTYACPVRESNQPIVNVKNSPEDHQEWWANAGDLRVEGGVILSGTAAWMADNTVGAHSVYVSTNSVFGLSSVDSGWYLPVYRLIMDEGSKFAVYGGPNEWQGPIELLDPKGHHVTAYDNGGLYIRGSISGSGLILDPDAVVTFTLDSDAFQHTFTNGVVCSGNNLVSIRKPGCLNPTGGDLVLSNSTFKVDDGRFYSLPRVRIAGTASEIQGRVDFDYRIDPDVNEDCFLFNHGICFDDGPTCAFSTNVVADGVWGLGDVTGVTTGAKAGVAGQQCRAFKALTSWNIDTADVVKGHQFRINGVLDLCDGIKVNLTGCARPKGGVRTYEIATASDGINWLGTYELNVEDNPDRWSLSVGKDGKTLRATYNPPGLSVIIR